MLDDDPHACQQLKQLPNLTVLRLLANSYTGNKMVCEQGAFGSLSETMGAGTSRNWKSGRGANQIGTLHRPGATRQGSHYDYVSDLIDMYNASCTVVEILIKDGATNSIRGEATGTFKAMTSFEFIFVLHLLEKKMMGVTDGLCQALQNKSQDTLTAMNLLARSTKDVLKKFRLDGWDIFFEEVESFC
ncbi:hypothetical protein L3X38_003826 [Prunus dulcis]|uniref:Uncharacterized protein n=1 Tax=Prunus dulcis TaxID=3755 RepID=A0AAD4ZMR0_PRUDU|nr:hypothetical protein L3X38_003826 [Prunus dulcis]